MASTPTPLTLMLLVDALRPDYLAFAPYLRSLARASATGTLRECFGFVPRAAYFGGLNAGEFGFTNMFCHDPERSPFTIARTLPLGPISRTSQSRAEARQMIEAAMKERLSPFARSYATSVEIPLPFLPSFDLVEKCAPWDPRAGFTSLFALLDERGIPWYQCSWPDTNRLADHSDQAIVQRVLTDLRPDHRFAYVHLQELDGTGHVYGPHSSPLQSRITATDLLCRELIEGLRQRFGALNLVLFGDHGMVSVTRTLDVKEALDQSGLGFGVDYAYFLDSTMARFWFFHRRAREIVEETLAGVTGGRVLSEEDLRGYGIEGCDRRNAELIFLADPGVLIFPNFFQSTGEPIKGMHGYDPDCPDNLGYFLLHDSTRPGDAGTRLGKVNPPALFPLLLDLLGLDFTPATQVKRPMPLPEIVPVAGYTGRNNPEAEALVEAQLRRILRAIEERVGPVQAVVLTGSFGRGEGGVYRDGEGRLHPVNDYDLLVVDPRDLSAPLRGLGDTLALELGIDFVDLSSSDGRWESLPLTIFNYDLKYGSRVIAGDPGVLDRIPAYASADIPIYETVKLLLNRTAGLLSGLRGSFLSQQQPTAAERRYLTNQIVKALMAMGDGYLLQWRGYDSSYRRRGERFGWLAPGAGLDPTLTAKVVQAYEFKCQPDYSRFASSLEEIRSLHPHLEGLLLQSINQLTEGRTKALSKALASYLTQLSVPADVVQADNTRCLAHPDMHTLLRPGCHTPVSLRHLVYSVLSPLLAAAVTPERAVESCHQVRQTLQSTFVLPPESGFDAHSWEQLRARVVQAWFAVCH